VFASLRLMATDMRQRLQETLLLVTVALVSLGMVAPLAWMLLGSVRREGEILARPFGWPQGWHWEQWATAWRGGNLGRYGWNSLGITLLSLAGTVLLGAAAAYALARRPGGASGPLLLYLLGLVVPAQAAVVPLFLLLRTLRLLDTWWALVLPYTAWNLPLAGFVFYGFFPAAASGPAGARRVGGCGPPRPLLRAGLPASAAA